MYGDRMALEVGETEDFMAEAATSRVLTVCKYPGCGCR